VKDDPECVDPAFTLAGQPTHKRLTGTPYDDALKAAQDRLRALQIAYMWQQARGVVVFEGWDASGKGGIIRRMAAVLEPRAVAFWSIGAPEAHWRGRHYLERFWWCLPEPGRLSIFDRSWYGRVLVERIENLATAAEWQRAYREINDFERMLMDDGIRLVKIFLHISSEEQLARFQKRLDDPRKRWKITAEDVRNCEKRAAYGAAIDDMIRQTSTVRAPWHVISADSKKFARIEALRIIHERLSADMDLRLPQVDPAVAEAAYARLGLRVPERL
jgi:polyphosphate kinase 2 (PPK2 family)